MTSTDLPPGAVAVVEHLAVTSRSLDDAERRDLAEVLLQWSGRRATRGPGRPLEVVSVVRDHVVPWRHPPTCEAGPGGPASSPDLTVQLAAARGSAVPLVGPALADVRRAVQEALPALLGDLVGDERNVLLTLARMVVTMRTREVVSKDVAAEVVAADSEPATAGALLLAARAYRGEAVDEWSDVPVSDVAAALAAEVSSDA